MQCKNKTRKSPSSNHGWIWTEANTKIKWRYLGSLWFFVDTQKLSLTPWFSSDFWFLTCCQIANALMLSLSSAAHSRHTGRPRVKVGPALQYWPLIGQYRSRDLNTGLLLVTRVTSSASDWLVTWPLLWSQHTWGELSINQMPSFFVPHQARTQSCLKLI